jgi:hypothetical protein
MKLRQVRNCFILSLMVPLIVAGVAQAQETPAATPPPLNPNAIAQLRWYEFNKVAQVIVLPTIHSAGIAFERGQHVGDRPV